MAGSIFIPLVSVFDAKGIREAQTSMKGLTVVLKSLKASAVAAAVSFATVGAGAFIKEATAAARDLDRNLVGLNGVFGSLTPTMVQFTKDAQAIGLSQVDAARASTFLGSVLKQSGFTMQDTAEQTKNLVGLASDLAATYGYDVSEALTGMTALFRGEYDPIEKFGVAMKQAEVNALLAARGQKNLTGATLRYAQAQARLDLLYARSTDAQGAFARQSDSLFVKQKQLNAAFDNMKASVGAALTDPLAKLLGALQPLIDRVGPALTPAFANLAKVIEMLTPVMLSLGEMAMELWNGLNPLFEILVEILKPVMVPLVAIFKLFVETLKAAAPGLQFFARIIQAVVVPILSVVAMILNIIIGLVVLLVKSFSKLPFVGDFFAKGSEELDKFADSFQVANDKILSVKESGSSMIGVLSKNYGGNSIDNVTDSSKEATAALKKTQSALEGLIEKAFETQRSLIGAFDITGVLKENTDSIVESVVFVDDKFKLVVSGVKKGSESLVGSFASNLTKLKGFYANFNKLLDKGLDPELLNQLVSAGPEAGNATAEAILASGQDGIDNLNKTFGGMRNIAGSIGAKLAKVMEKVGSRTGNGLIDGLIAQKDNLIAQATALGKSIGEATGSAIATYTDESMKLGFQQMSNVFVGSKVAGRTEQKGKIIMPILTPAQNITNPYSQEKAPTLYGQLQKNIEKATEYNISVNVVPGATAPEVGSAIVAAIQEYERKKGKGWRK